MVNRVCLTLTTKTLINAETAIARIILHVLLIQEIIMGAGFYGHRWDPGKLSLTRPVAWVSAHWLLTCLLPLFIVDCLAYLLAPEEGTKLLGLHRKRSCASYTWLWRLLILDRWWQTVLSDLSHLAGLSYACSFLVHVSV